MKWQNQRKAFSMITAVIVLILMATVAILIMNVSGKIVKETSAQFQREQAMLLAKSYTEYAIMAVTANDRNGTGNCLRDIDGLIKIDNSSTATVAQGNGYQIRTRIAYIGQISEVGSCASTRVFSNTVTTERSPLNIIVDVYVDYKDLDNITAPWITYHKRTLQKI